MGWQHKNLKEVNLCKYQKHFFITAVGGTEHKKDDGNEISEVTLRVRLQRGNTLRVIIENCTLKHANPFSSQRARWEFVKGSKEMVEEALGTDFDPTQQIGIISKIEMVFYKHIDVIRRRDELKKKKR